MINPSLNQQVSDDLLEILLQEENSTYPWNLTPSEADEYFSEQEQQFSLVECFDEDELTHQAQTLFSHLQQCWENLEVKPAESPELEEFRNLIPSSWLEKILEQAKQLIADSRDPLTRLVECVKPLFPERAEEDLQVFGRPFAYALRGNIEGKLIPWEERTESEKIRLTMKIAQETLKNLQKT